MDTVSNEWIDCFIGPGKPKEENNGWNNSGNQWSGGGNGGPPADPRRDPSWGPPPNVKPVGGSWGGQPQREQWHTDSPTIGRRMDDGGKYLDDFLIILPPTLL